MPSDNQSNSSPEKVNSNDERRKLYLLLVNYGMVLLAGLNTGWIGPLIPTIAKAHDMPVHDLGSLLSIQFFGCLLTMSFGKKTIDWIGIRMSILMAALIACLGFSVFALAPGAICLWIGSLLIGAGTGMNAIAGTVIVLRLAKENSATALNRVHLFFGLGALLGPLLGWMAHYSPWSYRSAFLFGAFCSAIFVYFTYRAIDLENELPDIATPPSKETLRKPLLWIYSLVMFFYVGIESGITTWLFVFLRKVSALPHIEASLGMSSLWLGLTISRHLSGTLCKKHSPYTVTISFMGLALLMLTLLATVPQMASMTLLVVFLIGLGFGPIFPTVLALVNNKFNHSTALVSTVAITTGFAGGIVYPLLVGKIFQNEGLVTGMSFVAVSCAFMILLFTTIIKSTQNRQTLELNEVSPRSELKDPLPGMLSKED